MSSAEIQATSSTTANLERRVRFLAWSMVASWALLAVLAIVVLGRQVAPPSDTLQITEIDAERIRILGPDGNPVMVIANSEHMAPPRLDGKEYSMDTVEPRKYQSGIIFFNEQGDEVGGLVYAGLPLSDSTHWANGQLTFDQWRQNQVVALQYIENARTRRAGLRIYDRPTNVPLSTQFDLLQARLDTDDEAERETITAELAAMSERGDTGVERMFVGSQDEVAQVQLRDTEGRMRARLYVDESDVARLEFFDEEGGIVSSYPPTP